MKEWRIGVRNSDLGNRCKVSSAKGKIIDIYNSSKCLVKNDNGTEHIQLRSNVMVLR